MPPPRIVDSESWLERRLTLLEREKELTRLRDELTLERQELPWCQIDARYLFEDETGDHELSQLFGDKEQLIVYHFMYGSDWEQGCKSCSFWADNFNGIQSHLAARDIAFVVVSSASIGTINRFKERMGWHFRWLSCVDGKFNHDFHVTFDDTAKQAGKIEYNYAKQNWFTEELPGVSVFIKQNSQVFHTYSTYSRGLDILNGAYNFIDLTPKGRNEDGKGMSWVKLHDQYD